MTQERFIAVFNNGRSVEFFAASEQHAIWQVKIHNEYLAEYDRKERVVTCYAANSSQNRKELTFVPA